MSCCPLFFWGLFFLFGVAAAIWKSALVLLPLALVLTLTKRRGQACFLSLVGFCYTFLILPPTLDEPLFCRGHFIATSITPSFTPFQRSVSLKGTLTRFEDLKQIPCTLYTKSLPKSGSSWIIEGKLEQKNEAHYTFKPAKGSRWLAVDAPRSLVRIRYEMKERVRRFFHRRYGNTKVGHFFTSMATGDTDDRLLSMEFQKLGLSHILAISGFHFALIALLVGLILRSFFSPRVAYFSLIAFLTLYFLFLGPTPSILRAYVMIILYLTSHLLRRKAEGLNLLGGALLIELMLNPLSVTRVGFQLSYLATFGILAFYRPFAGAVSKFLPRRPLHEVSEMKLLDKHGFLLSSALREAIALNGAVHLTTLPLLFFTFGSFPLLSLPYNLLFPPLFSLSLLLLPIGLLFPPIGTLNTLFTKWILGLIAHPPELLNFKLYTPTFPTWLLTLFLTLLICFGLTTRRRSSYN